TRDLCRGFYPGEPAPDVIVCVVDATNLRLHLRFALEVRELGRPMVLALNMVDVAARRGVRVDRAVLEAELGVPVVETVAVRQDGAAALVDGIEAMAVAPRAPARWLGGDAPQDPPPAGEALHAETRRLLALAVTMP